MNKLVSTPNSRRSPLEVSPIKTPKNSPTFPIHITADGRKFILETHQGKHTQKPFPGYIGIKHAIFNSDIYPDAPGIVGDLFSVAGIDDIQVGNGYLFFYTGVKIGSNGQKMAAIQFVQDTEGVYWIHGYPIDRLSPDKEKRLIHVDIRK